MFPCLRAPPDSEVHFFPPWSGDQGHSDRFAHFDRQREFHGCVLVLKALLGPSALVLRAADRILTNDTTSVAGGRSRSRGLRRALALRFFLRKWCQRIPIVCWGYCGEISAIMARSAERNTPSGLVSRAGSAGGSVVTSCAGSADGAGRLGAVGVFLNFLNQRRILCRDGRVGRGKSPSASSFSLDSTSACWGTERVSVCHLLGITLII